MNKKKFDAFQKLRDEFKQYTAAITGKDPSVIPVYNQDIDRFTINATIKYILLADNPGREEAAEHRYLIGHAGRQARNFFESSSLADNFAGEVMVLNKTCIYTNSTTDLRGLKKSELFAGSQKFMAELAFKFHKILDCEMWIVGCSELRDRGIFSQFKQTLTDCYAGDKNSLKEKVFCYKHFSFGNFSHDLKAHPSPDINVKLKDIGTEMKEKFLGW